MTSKDDILLRKQIILVSVIILFFLLIVSRLFYFCIIEHNRVSDTYRFNNSEISFKKRNNIVDKNNVLIATDIKVKTLFINKSLIDNPEYVAKTLSKILDIKYSFVLNKIKSSKNKANLILIKKHILPKEEFELWNSGLACIVFEDDVKRFYPNKNLFSHIVGYTDTDMFSETSFSSEFSFLIPSI